MFENVSNYRSNIHTELEKNLPLFKTIDMKKLIVFTCLALLSLSHKLNAQEEAVVSLKITYNGKAVCGHDVTIKAGNVSLAKGITDEKGEVKFKPVMLPSHSVDVYGYKKTADGEKKWELKGYVTLNDAFHADITMETYINQMAKDSGMPASMLIGAWGLNVNCDGSVDHTDEKQEIKLDGMFNQE